jgi:hypothetical protein
MKKTILTLSLIAFTLLADGQAQAVDKQNRYLILGPGSNSCAVVLSDLAEGVKRKDNAADVIYTMWLAGSLTGYNRDSKSTYSIIGNMSFQDVFKWTLDFCKEHPQQIYSAAADAFIHEYYDDRHTSMTQQPVKQHEEKPGEDDDKDDEK